MPSQQELFVDDLVHMVRVSEFLLREHALEHGTGPSTAPQLAGVALTCAELSLDQIRHLQGISGTGPDSGRSRGASALLEDVTATRRQFAQQAEPGVRRHEARFGPRNPDRPAGLSAHQQSALTRALDVTRTEAVQRRHDSDATLLYTAAAVDLFQGQVLDTVQAATIRAQESIWPSPRSSAYTQTRLQDLHRTSLDRLARGRRALEAAALGLGQDPQAVNLVVGEHARDLAHVLHAHVAGADEPSTVTAEEAGQDLDGVHAIGLAMQMRGWAASPFNTPLDESILARAVTDGLKLALDKVADLSDVLPPGQGLLLMAGIANQARRDRHGVCALGPSGHELHQMLRPYGNIVGKLDSTSTARIRAAREDGARVMSAEYLGVALEGPAPPYSLNMGLEIALPVKAAMSPATTPFEHQFRAAVARAKQRDSPRTGVDVGAVLPDADLRRMPAPEPGSEAAGRTDTPPHRNAGPRLEPGRGNGRETQSFGRSLEL